MALNKLEIVVNKQRMWKKTIQSRPDPMGRGGCEFAL